MKGPVVKICGVRAVHHAQVAAEAGADMVGLIFAVSRRRVTPDEAREIMAAAYPRRPRFVGVFVNEDPDVIGRLSGELRLDLVQLSGDEAPDECARLRVPYFKVIHVASGMTAQDVLRRAHRYPDAAAIVLDSGGRRQAAGGGRQPSTAYRPPPTAYGGTGRAIDPAVAAEVVRQTTRPVVLAGGLHAETVAGAVRAVRPWGVDVSSGVETDGAKDDAKIMAFVAAAKEAV